MSGLGLLLGTMSSFTALLQARSGLIAEAADTSKGRDIKVIQSWSHLSLTAKLGELVLPLADENIQERGCYT